MSNFEPKELLQHFYRQLCMQDSRSKKPAVMRSDVYSGDITIPADQPLCLAVEIPGARPISMLVIAAPVPENLPAGKGIYTVHLGSSRTTVTTHRFLVPVGEDNADTWRRLSADGQQLEDINFGDYWRGLVKMAQQGPEPYPFGCFLYAKGTTMPKLAI